MFPEIYEHDSRADTFSRTMISGVIKNWIRASCFFFRAQSCGFSHIIPNKFAQLVECWTEKTANVKTPMDFRFAVVPGILCIERLSGTKCRLCTKCWYNNNQSVKLPVTKDRLRFENISHDLYKLTTGALSSGENYMLLYRSLFRCLIAERISAGYC